MRKLWIVLAGVSLFSVAGVVPRAYAVPITYSVSATATGSLGGSPFTDALVTITVSSDTSTVSGGGNFFSNTGPGTAAVAGIGTATLTGGGLVFANHTGGPTNIGAAGIETALGGDILDTVNAAFASYDLKSAIGPISGPPIINSGTPFPTSLGSLILTSVSGN